MRTTSRKIVGKTVWKDNRVMEQNERKVFVAQKSAHDQLSRKGLTTLRLCRRYFRRLSNFTPPPRGQPHTAANDAWVMPPAYTTEDVQSKRAYPLRQRKIFSSTPDTMSGTSE